MMDRPVLLCGLGKVGRSVLAVLRAAHMPVVVVDLQPAPADGLDGVRYVRGDFRQTEVLAEAGVRDARGVIICASVDLAGEAVLRAGDRLTAVGAPRDLGRLLSSGDVFDSVHWAGKLRRFSRVAGRTLAEIDLSVKVCTSVLLAVVVGSTLVFHFGM